MMISSKHFDQRGFTLIELAISLIIIGLLLGGIAIPISDSFSSSQSRQNIERLNAAKDALIGFVIANQRLPCPTNVWSGAGEGQEPTFCSNNDTNTGTVSEKRDSSGVISGIIPWNTLGIQRDDAYGNPIYYTVERRLTFHETSSNETTVNDDSLRDIAINNKALNKITIEGFDEANNNAKVTLANNVAVVLTSLGRLNAQVSPNGSNSSYINGLSTESTHSEKINVTSCCSVLPYLNNTDSRKFHIRNLSDNKDTKDNSSNTIGAYDDQIVWIPWYQLIGIMTQAGRLQ